MLKQELSLSTPTTRQVAQALKGHRAVVTLVATLAQKAVELALRERQVSQVSQDSQVSQVSQDSQVLQERRDNLDNQVSLAVVVSQVNQAVAVDNQGSQVSQISQANQVLVALVLQMTCSAVCHTNSSCSNSSIQAVNKLCSLLRWMTAWAVFKA